MTLRVKTNKGMFGEKEAYTIKDLYSGLIHCYPVPTKNSADVIHCLEHFRGERKIRRMYADRAGEIMKACAKVGAAKEPSRPGDPRNNSIVERLNQAILSGARTALDCAGLPACFWNFAIECYCILHNTEIPDGDGASSAWCKTHGE